MPGEATHSREPPLTEAQRHERGAGDGGFVRVHRGLFQEAALFLGFLSNSRGPALCSSLLIRFKLGILPFLSKSISHKEGARGEAKIFMKTFCFSGKQTMAIPC